MENLISALVLAAVSALGIIAYRHPAAYQRLYLVLIGTSFVVFFGMLIWDGGGRAARRALMPFVKPESIDAASNAVEGVLAASSFQVLLIFLAINAYLTVLLGLPYILGLPERKP